MKNKCVAALTASVLGLAVGFTGVCSAAENTTITYPDPCIKENLPDTKPDAKTDFFLSINYDEMVSTELPEGRSSYTNFVILNQEIEKNMIDLLNGGQVENDLYQPVVDLFSQYVNMDKRNADGWTSVEHYIDEIMNCETVNDYLQLIYSDLYLADLTGPMSVATASDQKDCTINSLCMYVPSLTLGDSAEYTALTELGSVYKEANGVYFKKLLTKYGFSEEDADRMINDQLAWETLISASIYPTETSYREDYPELTYNACTKEELENIAGDFPIDIILEDLGISQLDKYILDQPDYYKNLSSYYCNDNLQLIKSNAIIKILVNASKFTDEESFGYFNDWYNAKNGSTGMPELSSLAYDTVCSVLSELTGQLYADTFFSADKKKDVEDIVYDIIDAMKTRLENNDWMTDATRQIALEKLSAVNVFIGYPEELYYDYSTVSVDNEKSLYENYISVTRELVRQDLLKAGQPVVKSAWGNTMAPNAVNACYVPETNSICFPAAILQAPFYDEDASFSAKMGGIGAVIGHELTHAFDTTGSQYDKYGNLSNWWTEEDRAAFKERTAKVAQRYASYATVDDTHVNGDLTIGETVADLGGFALALDVVNAKKAAGEEVSYEEMFTTNAKIWFKICTRNSALSRLKNDPHAPNALRVNVNLTQFDEFYETFGVEAGDPMYTAPEDRLIVW